jgi:hypothetical protein
VPVRQHRDGTGFERGAGGIVGIHDDDDVRVMDEPVEELHVHAGCVAVGDGLREHPPVLAEGWLRDEHSLVAEPGT